MFLVREVPGPTPRQPQLCQVNVYVPGSLRSTISFLENETLRGHPTADRELILGSLQGVSVHDRLKQKH